MNMKMKQSARLVAMGVARVLRRRPWVLTAAATPRCISRTVSSASQSGIPKGLNTSNPFEIKFHVGDSPADAAEDDGAIESSFFEDEIDKFHSEMIGVFGSEPAEHDDSGHDQPADQSAPSSTQNSHTTILPGQARSPIHPAVASPPRQLQDSRTPTLPKSLHDASSRQSSSIVFIQGPCTFVHEAWVGSKDRWSAANVAAIARDIAQSHELDIVQHHSNHEGQILDWLLTTAPGDNIILNWNGRLTDSPLVYRALSSIRASVVILAPLDVELGPLPLSVKGVISGFDTRSLELAIQACK